MAGTVIPGTSARAEILDRAYREIAYYTQQYPPLRTLAAVSSVHVADHGAVPGDGIDDIPALQRAIDHANTLPKPVEVLFQPGVYEFGNSVLVRPNGSPVLSEPPAPALTHLSPGSQMALRGSQTTGGGQTTILIRDPHCQFVQTRDVEFVLIENFVVDHEHPPFLQGVIVGKHGNAIEVDVDPSFPQQADWRFFRRGGKRYVIPKDPRRPGMHPRNKGNTWVTTQDKTRIVQNLGVGRGPNGGDVSIQLAGVRRASIGDTIVHTLETLAKGFSFSRSKYVTVKDTTIFGAYGTGVNGLHNFRIALINFHQALKPGHLLNSGRDAMICRASPGVWIESSTIGNSGDDATNHNAPGAMPTFISELMPDARTFVAASWWRNRADKPTQPAEPAFNVARLAPGEPVYIFHNQHGLVGFTSIAARHGTALQSPANVGRYGIQPNGFTYVLSDSLARLTVERGYAASDLFLARADAGNQGHVILNSNLVNSRRKPAFSLGNRALLLYGNRITGHAGDIAEYGIGPRVGSMVVSANHFEDNRLEHSNPKIAWLNFRPSQELRSLEFGRHAVERGRSHGWIFRNNTFRLHPTEDDMAHILGMAELRDVVVEGNKVVNPQGAFVEHLPVRADQAKNMEYATLDNVHTAHDPAPGPEPFATYLQPLLGASAIPGVSPTEFVPYVPDHANLSATGP